MTTDRADTDRQPVEHAGEGVARAEPSAGAIRVGGEATRAERSAGAARLGGDAARAGAIASPAHARRLLSRSPAGGRGLVTSRAQTVLALQRARGNRAVTRLLQRDFAIAPTVPDAPAVELTAQQMQIALRLNRVMFTDAAETAVIRDVLGIAREPSVPDEDFANAVVRYQGAFGLNTDGILGRGTSERLAAELTAEADFLGDPVRGTELRRAARRLHLRSLVSRTRGLLEHQGFVGADDLPEGAVTVRIGDRQAPTTNAISLEYTGENSDNVDWLQFISMQMFATPPGAAAPVFNAGTVATTGGPVNWSDAVTERLFVDAVPGGSPLYNTSGFLNTRAAARRIAMFDEPGGPSGLPAAQAFVAGGPAAGATRVTLRMRFDSYVIRNNRARYRVGWTATTTYDTTAGTSSDIVYHFRSGQAVSGLAGRHRTALLGEYPGNPIR